MQELDKNPDIRITELERKTGLPIGQVCKIRHFWKLEKRRDVKRYAACRSIEKIR